MQSLSEYDAYGNEYPITTGAKNQFRFAGKHGYQLDESTGLMLLGHRYYAAKLGRFLTQDPIGQEGGLNLYAYCANNPLVNVDPNGLREITGADRDRIRKVRGYMHKENMNDKYINVVTRDLKSEILAVKGSSDPVRLLALWYAIDHLGDTSYGSSGSFNQCNIFVYDSYLYGADSRMPDRNGWRFGTQPYGANMFGNAGIWLRYTNRVGSGKPGDIFAFGSKSESMSGHMTMKVASGLLIYAGSEAVKLGTFQKNQMGHKKVVIREHTGDRR